MWNFAEDLIKWKEAEKRIMDLLNENWFNLIQNPIEKEIDLLIINGGIEIKKDEYAKKSWNFYIEFECNWKPSWLYRPEKHKLIWWVHTDWEKVYMVYWDKLKNYVKNKIEECRLNTTLTSKWFRVVEQWWNWWRTKGLLFPLKEMEIIADNLFNY